MFQDKSLMTVADAAGVVGEAPDGYVQLNGVVYKLPTDYPIEVAKEIVMIEVDTKNLPTVHVPQFRLDACFGIKPKVYSSVKDIALKAASNSSGETAMDVNLPLVLEDSKETLTVDAFDVVTSGKEKLSDFKKPSEWVAKRLGTLYGASKRPLEEFAVLQRTKTRALAIDSVEHVG